MKITHENIEIGVTYLTRGEKVRIRLISIYRGTYTFEYLDKEGTFLCNKKSVGSYNLIKEKK